MVNRCRAVGCRGVDEDPEQKVSLWKFPYDRPELLPFWVSFVNRQNWSIDPVNKTDYLCSLHFETKIHMNGQETLVSKLKVEISAHNLIKEHLKILLMSAYSEGAKKVSA